MERNESSVFQIRADDLDRVKQMAGEAPSKRARICLHDGHDDPVQEMLIAVCSESNIRPHRQQNKSKSYTWIEGRLRVEFFEPRGHLTDRIEMGGPASGRVFLCRFPAGRWHTVRALSDVAVYVETISGPYRPEESEWAPWEPPDSRT